MANRGIEIGDDPVDLAVALSLEANQEYTLAALDRPRVFIGDYSAKPNPNPRISNPLPLIPRKEEYHMTIRLPETGSTYAWCDKGRKNHLVVNEAI